MKRKSSIFLSALLSLSVLAGCAETGVSSSSSIVLGEPVWGEFSEQAEGYVYELYNFEIPTVTDGNGKELKVNVTATDKNGKTLDTTGGFFVVWAEETYTLTYSVEHGGKTYTKTATVTGIPKTEYALKPMPLYGIGEKVDLKNSVTSTLGGEIHYTVQKGGKSVAVTDGAFVPEESGTYTVIASIAKQPDYEYSVTVVDKNLYPYPNGLITDTADSATFSASIDSYSVPESGEAYRNQEELLENANVTLTHSEETYYGEGNGSTHIAVEFPENCKTFTCDISYKPEFDVEYYRSLQQAGYEDIVVRMKVEHSNPNLEKEWNLWGLYPFKGDQSTIPVAVYNTEGEKVVEKPSTFVAWNNDLEKLNGEWMEMVLPLSQFISRYNASGMTLFKYKVNAPYAVKNGDKEVKFDNMFGTLNVYIDNVYVGKPLHAENAELTEKTPGSVYSLSEVSVGTDTADLDEVINTVSVNGKKVVAENGELTLSEDGVYSVARRARNRYGVAKTRLAVVDTKNINTTLRACDSVSGLTASAVYNENSTSVVGDVQITYDETQGAVKAVSQRNTYNVYYDLLVETAYSKEYFEYLRSKTDEYKYVTVKVGIPVNTNAFISTGAQSHRNHFNSTTSGVWLNDGGELKQINKVSYWESGIDWLEISVSIDDFIANMNGNTAKLFRLFTAGSDITLYIDGIYLTKDGKLSEHT